MKTQDYARAAADLEKDLFVFVCDKCYSFYLIFNVSGSFIRGLSERKCFICKKPGYSFASVRKSNLINTTNTRRKTSI